ncbi:uncharacterized protein LOC144620787 [Crassostrea virginica]
MEEAYHTNEELNSGSECQNLQTNNMEKSKRTRTSRKSSSGSSKKDTNEKMDQLESRVNDRLDTMMTFLRESIETLSNSVFENSQNRHDSHVSMPMNQDTGGSSTRRPEPILSNVDDSFGMRPIIPLESEVQIERTVSVPEMDDIISLAPSVREVSELLGENESSVQEDSNTQLDSDHSQFSLDSNNNRFQNLINKDAEQTKTLNDIFGNVSSTDESKVGLILDKTQEEILKKSWRIADPERLSAYREEYRQCFPIHPNSSAFLQVPGLDDILEPMLRKQHGTKANKGWGKSRHLVSQPFKSIETLAYQGQIAARMGIISLSYMQQALGILLSSISCQDAETVQAIKDIFSMSVKALDQMGRTGAFHHLIRRKTAAQDTGLYTLKDVHSKIICLPLSDDGVFGKKLEEKLKERKEQKDSLKDLIPEWTNQKRKFSENTDNSGNNFKKPRLSNMTNNRTSNQKSNFSKKSYNYKSREDNTGNTSTSTSTTDNRLGSFRIPKKSNK